jgi:predicted CXXCH cytochrome family protein
MTHRPTHHWLPAALLRVWLALLLLGGTSLAMAQGAPATRSFEHIKTGFALTGQHANERCESCHINGVFKGTPRDCASCHTSGTRWSRNNVVKSQSHFPTQQACDTCHSTQSYAGAKFNHVGVNAGACATCHTGSMAAGKPSSHVQTSASCDSCHKTTGWTPASGFDHAGVTPGTCATCHNGSRATGKAATHVPVGNQSCDSCHRSGGSWKPSSFNHTQLAVTNQCASCHTGGFPPADGRNANHIPYQALAGAAISNCDSCHKGGFASWTPARFHASVSVSTQCASCHSGGFARAVGKPNTAIHNGVTACESCHKSTASWAGAKVDHSIFTTATNCTTCHNGSTATGKSATHVPVAATNCVSCHSTSTWKPTTFNHTQVVATNQCSSCHTGAFPPADGRNATHIPYQTLSGVAITNCDTCHKQGYTAWTGARFHSSVTVSTQCASCHTGSYPPAVAKPNNATHAGVTVCESCHKSTAAWSTVTFAHSAANAVGTGTCDTCHNGSAARGKPATHIPVTTGPTKCDSCHRSQASWATSVTMNHTAVTATTCKTCHNGAYLTQGTTGALAKPTNHIPEGTQLLNGAAMDCNACHKSTTTWGSMTMSHNGSQGGGAGWCKGCHASGTSYLGSMEKKSLTHRTKTPPAIDCSESGCHRPLGTRGTTYSNWD